MFRLVSLLVILAGNAFAVVNPVELHIINEVVSPDGVLRPAVLAKKPLEKPPEKPVENSLHTIISGQKDDEFRINVVNKLTDNRMDMPTSIHWHGLFMQGTAWADGAAFVSQCPITPNDEFLYKFQPKQAGTFWYHSHLRTQYCDGLRGPLIIRDPKDPHADKYDYDEDTTVVTISDWYHIVSTKLRDLPFAKVSPNSTLINGLGRTKSKDGKSATGSFAVITVTQGKRYRFRLLNMACDIWFTFSIDQHTSLKVIEVDGVNHQPLEVDSIHIYAGQRYSFVLEANQKIGNYWIRAKPPPPPEDDPGNKPPGDKPPPDAFEFGLNMAILRYVGAREDVPTTCLDESKKPLREQDLQPLDTTSLGPPDQEIKLTIDLLEGDTFAVNGFTYEPPSIPVLLQILSGKVQPQDIMPKGSVIMLKPNQVVEITFDINAEDEENPHPMHLHGHAFHVIRSAGSQTDNKYPPIRDTVNAGEANATYKDEVKIRFKTDNSGPWILHCHIDWHLDRGLAIVMAEDTGRWKESNPVPVSWENLCPKYYHKPVALGGSFLMTFLPSWLQFAFAMQ